MANTNQQSSVLRSPSSAGGLVLPGDRAPDVVAFETAMVEFFVDAAELLGVPKSVAAIYGIVFASPAPVSFADIESRLNISKGSVSQGLKALREVGAVKEVSTDADKTELFQPDLEMRQLVARFIESRVERQLDSGKGKLKHLNQATSAYANGQQKVLRQRIQKLQQWHDRTHALLPMIKTVLKLGG
jgi:DNA-binding transcriptional regulator GbsR (MarR family)